MKEEQEPIFYVHFSKEQGWLASLLKAIKNALSWRFFLDWNRPRRSFRIECDMFSPFGIQVKVTREEDDLNLALGFFIGCLYIHFGHFCRMLGWRADRSWGFSVFEGAIHITIGAEANGWSDDQPKWRDIYVNIRDVVFGPATRHEEVIEERDEILYMPEKNYTAHVKLVREWWTRPRLWYRLYDQMSCDVSVDGGVPIPGKGENSWDCGDDATFSMFFRNCSSIDMAVDRFRDDAFQTRASRGGRGWQPKEVTA